MVQKSMDFCTINFATMFIQPIFKPSACLANVTKISRRTRNKINAIPVFNRNMIFKRGKETLKQKRDRILEILKEIEE